VSQAIVSDSTILIGLERIEHLYVLPTVFEPILIPPAVEQEFGIDLPWLQVEVPTNQGLISALKLSVDEGEAEAIALAYQLNWQIILDDRQARTVAKNMGISIIGTIGVLVKAKQAGTIPLIKPLLDN